MKTSRKPPPARASEPRRDYASNPEPGEPCFVLRAQDMLAPELVEAWAIEAELNGCCASKVADARRIADAMRRWPKRKMPD